MRLKLTPAQLAAQPAIIDVLFSKMLANIEWSTRDLSRSQIQYCLDNDIVLDKAELYSPVLSDSQVSALVPLSWPGGHTVDEEGEAVSRLPFIEYLRSTEVTGGTVLQFAGSKIDTNRNITLPTYAQLKAQIGISGGFLTGEEVDDIKIVEEEEEV